MAGRWAFLLEKDVAENKEQLKTEGDGGQNIGETTRKGDAKGT